MQVSCRFRVGLRESHQFGLGKSNICDLGAPKGSKASPSKTRFLHVYNAKLSFSTKASTKTSAKKVGQRVLAVTRAKKRPLGAFDVTPLFHKTIIFIA